MIPFSGFDWINFRGAVISSRTMTRWCESGKIIAFPKKYGETTTYEIPELQIDALLAEQEQKIAAKEQANSTAKNEKSRPHKEFIEDWKLAMSQGMLTGKPFSSKTIGDYVDYAEKFLAEYPMVSYENLYQHLLIIPKDNFGKREKIYKAVLCFGKFLIQQRQLEASFIDETKSLRPRSHKSPKRKTVSAEDLGKLYKACETLQETMLLALLSEAGLRAGEACNLRCRHIQLKERKLYVEEGKGGKSRVVGITDRLYKAILRYGKATPTEKRRGYLLKNRDGKKMHKDGVGYRVAQIAERAKVEAHPHALRRAFVTLNASNGVPLPHLQRIAGHASIKTTEIYCLIDENEVAESMQNWKSLS